jgi:hypothetical protein
MDYHNVCDIHHSAQYNDVANSGLRAATRIANNDILCCPESESSKDSQMHLEDAVQNRSRPCRMSRTLSGE